MEGEDDSNFFRRRKGPPPAKEAPEYSRQTYGAETTSSLSQLYSFLYPPNYRLIQLYDYNLFRSPETQLHLRNVYGNLAITTGFAALAFWLVQNRYIMPPGILALILLFGCMFTVMLMPARPSNSLVRHGALYGLGFSQGWVVAPMVMTSLLLNPQTVLITLVATLAIFGSFTLSAYYSPRRQYIYLGGLLGTVVALMFLASLANLWIGSRIFASVELYLGLFVFSLYVLYDTQVIVERSEAGQQDSVSHALLLFTDLAAIFIRLLAILGKNDREDDNGNGGGGRGRKRR